MPFFNDFIKSIFIFLTVSSFLLAQDTFTRIDSILVPEVEACGFGEIIAGVDFDGDNFLEIYAVNNMQDGPEEHYTPRIYKFEYDGTTWQQVWDEDGRDYIIEQNSWPPLTYNDLDKDGLNELYWAPANYFAEDNTNPPRFIVWEANGDDRLGKAGFGFDSPSATWTITDQDNFNVRPFRIIFNDIDSDGTEELIFADRVDNYRFGVVSITDIPNGTGEEVWTLEASGLESTLAESAIYDMAIIGTTIYLFHSDGSVTPVKFEGTDYTIMDNIPDILPGGSWKSSNSVDLNNDGTNEIVIGGWQVDGKRTNNKVFLVQEDETDIISISQIANFEPLIDTVGRINGGHDAFGDLDNDGNLDFIFGTRNTTPEVAILRMEYLGGEISDSNSYEISVIDSLYPTVNAGRYDVVTMANLDDDPELEVIYTNGATCEMFPIVILDLNKPVSVNDKILPSEFALEQNYPNPFNPNTNIKFSLPEKAEVSLRIFNTLGETIAVILNKEELSKGNHSYNFNAQNLSSGIYFYTLESEFGISTKKMILLK